MPNLSLYALVPLTEAHLVQGCEVAVCPTDVPYMTIPQLESTIEEK